MDNLKTQTRDTDVKEVLSQPANTYEGSATPHKTGRGRPPGRSRRESGSSNVAEAELRETLVAATNGAELTPRRLNGQTNKLSRNRLVAGRANNDKPIFTLSVAAEILHLHPRTLRIYEEQDLVIPTRTQTNRRRYSQNDIKKFQFIQYLTRERGVNLSGVRIILALLEEIRKTIPEPIAHVFPDYGESEGFPLL